MEGRTFLKQNAFEQRIFVSEHETVVGGGTMALLERGEGVVVLLDGGLELFDIFGATFTEGSLRLTVALLALFRRGVNLKGERHDNTGSNGNVLTGLRPPLRFCGGAGSCSTSGSGGGDWRSGVDSMLLGVR